MEFLIQQHFLVDKKKKTKPYTFLWHFYDTYYFDTKVIFDFFNTVVVELFQR